MSWATGTEGTMKGTGGYNPNSALAKKYAGLKEDGGSRVDDEAGWREIWKDAPPKSAAEYESRVKEYASQGFDVKAIDMAGGDFSKANFAIKPMGDTGGSSTKDEKIQLSKRAGQALAGVETYQDWRAGTGKSGYGNETDLIFGSAEESKAANQKFADEYKLNLKKHLTPGKASGYTGAGEMTAKANPSDIAKKIVGKAKQEF